MPMAEAYALKKRKKMNHGGDCYAHGGEVSQKEIDMAEEDLENEDLPEAHDKMNMAADMEDEDMIKAIMRKRFSKGGRVANDTDMSTDFKENEFDDLVLRDDLEQHYTGENSGDELGNERLEDDERDLVKAIMRSRSKKGKMPHPM